MDDKTKEKLGRLKALAEHGIGGERDNAAKLLDRLLKKYGARLDELDDEQEQDFFFKYSGKEQSEWRSTRIRITTTALTFCKRQQY